MLWYKAWLETRWRTLLPLGMILLALFQAHTKGTFRLGPGPLLAVLPVFWMLAPLTLAGSGIATESPFRAVKGAEGSVYFTLSLPVSRLRLLVMRAAFGTMATASVILAVCCFAGLAFPEVRQHIAIADGFRYMLTVLLCSSAMYGLSTFFATFLDQQWQVLALVIAVLLLRWLTNSDALLFGAMGNSSPLVTHTIPWLAISISLAIGLASLFAAAKVVEAREY